MAIDLDFSQPICDFGGEPIVDSDGNEVPMKNAVMQMIGSYVGDGDKSEKLYQLGKKIKADEGSYTSEEIVLLKEVVEENDNYTALLKGQLLEYLSKH